MDGYIYRFYWCLFSNGSKIENFNIYSLFPLICALCYSFTVVIQKKTSVKYSLFSQVIHIYISAIIFSLIIRFSLGIIDFDPEIVFKYKFLLTEWNISNYQTFFMLIVIGLTAFQVFYAYLEHITLVHRHQLLHLNML